MSAWTNILNDPRTAMRYTAREELALWERMQAGENEARELLVLSQVQFALWLGNVRYGDYMSNNRTRSDIQNELLLSVVEAVSKLNPSRGRLSTLVAFKLRSNCLERIRRIDQMIPVSMYEEKRGWLVECSIDIDRGLHEKNVWDTATAVLDQRNEVDEIDNAEELRQLLWYLTRRARDMLLRVAINGETLASVAKRYGRTRERVRQINMASIRKMKRCAR